MIIGIGMYCLQLYGNSTVSPKNKEKRPNVLFILTDDQGSIDVNCYGAKDLYTPNMDGLAQQGIRFNRFYVAAPICSPSRASLLTGLSPQAAGLPGNASSLPGHKGMPTEKVTMAEVMKKAGYVTGHVGKWHLGFTPETMPNGHRTDTWAVVSIIIRTSFIGMAQTATNCMKTETKYGKTENIFPI
ncbi:sulfatase family protein [Saccharicrinis sp. GN24d3]